MSVGLYNHDTSFFEIRSPDIDEAQLISGQNLINLSISEQMGEIDSGSITLNDPNHQYSRLLRIGAEIEVTWGYRAPDPLLQSRIFPERNPDEIRGGFERTMRGIVQSPKGSAGSDGKIQYECEFIAIVFRGGKARQIYERGTYGSIVREVLQRIGIADFIIDFERQRENATPSQPVYQYESDFQFLLRLGREWRAAFKIGYKTDGTLVGMFVNPEKSGFTQFKNKVTGASGLSNYFDYNGDAGNVISYDWKNNQGDRGVGSGANLQIVNGEVQIQRYVVEQDKVVTWKLNETKLEEHLEEIEATQGLEGKLAFYRNYLQARTFEEIEEFFTPVETETAPQGFGYTVNMEILGNPLITVTNIAEFGDGFPTMIGNSRTTQGVEREITWYVRRVNHTLSRSGYRASVEVVDQYAVSDTGVVIQ